jgi:hypothetical protein
MKVGATQVSAITVAFVIPALLASKLGGSGFVKITAPFPAIDTAELPTKLMA